MFKYPLRRSPRIIKVSHALKWLGLSFIILSTLITSRANSQETYTIKKGDTLWAISDRFLHDPFKWQEIWRLNPFIVNPNLIYPGDRIKLKSPEEVKPEVKPVVEEKELEVREGPKEVVKESVPAVVKLSLHEFKKGGFISPEDLKGSGIILESKEGDIIIGKGDVVYVGLVEGKEVAQGDRFLIFEVKGEITHPFTRQKIGYKIEPLGVLTITGRDKGMYEGVIDESYQEIFKGARLKPFEPPLREVVIKEEAPSIEGVIIGSLEEKVSLGEGDVVYIDKGEEDGLSVGNILSVYKKKEGIFNPLDKKRAFPSPTYIGKILLIHTDKKTSTAFILTSREEIYIGYVVMGR